MKGFDTGQLLYLPFNVVSAFLAAPSPHFLGGMLNGFILEASTSSPRRTAFHLVLLDGFSLAKSSLSL